MLHYGKDIKVKLHWKLAFSFFIFSAQFSKGTDSAAFQSCVEVSCM